LAPTGLRAAGLSELSASASQASSAGSGGLFRALNFVNALLEPGGVIFVAGEQAQAGEGGARFRVAGGEFFERTAFQRALQAHGKRVPLLFGRKLIPGLDLGRGELVEERFPELKKAVSRGIGGRRFGRGRLRREGQREEEDQRAAGKTPSADSGVGARLRAMGSDGRLRSR
jgi:hypothetical protein